jgi:membrane protein implicated in regulation of membrane protease activity
MKKYTFWIIIGILISVLSFFVPENLYLYFALLGGFIVGYNIPDLIKYGW